MNTRRSRFSDDDDPLAGVGITPIEKDGQVATMATREPERTSGVPDASSAQTVVDQQSSGATTDGDSAIPGNDEHANGDKGTPPPPQPETRVEDRPPVTVKRTEKAPATETRQRVHYTLRGDCIEFAEEMYRQTRRPDGSRWRSASQYVEFLLLMAKERTRTTK